MVTALVMTLLVLIQLLILSVKPELAYKQFDLWGPLYNCWRRWTLWIRPKVLLQMASELGLELKGYRFTSFEMAGQRGPLAIELHCRTGRSVSAQVRQPGIPTSLRLAARRRLETPAVSTGDESFDDVVTVGGDATIAAALLDLETRKRIRELVMMGFGVDSSFVDISRSCLGRNLRGLVLEGAKMIEHAVALSDLLTIQGPEIPSRLARIAASDPLPAVRQKCLLALTDYPEHPESLRRHLAALEETWPEIRLLAASFLIALPGIDSETATTAARVLVQLARSAELPEEFRARAIRSFADHKGDAASIRAIAEPLITDVLNEKTGTLLVAAIGSLAALELRNLIPRLEELAPTAKHPVAIAIVKALGVFGGQEAQAILLQLLERPGPQIPLEAAEALGAVGDSQAVEPLLELSRFNKKSRLGQTALDAARRIQGRLIGAETGQLSLAATAELEGALSPTGLAGPGDLTLAEAAPPAPVPPRRVIEGS